LQLGAAEIIAIEPREQRFKDGEILFGASMTQTGRAIVGPSTEAAAATPSKSPASAISRRGAPFRFLTVPWLAQFGCDMRAGAAAAVVTLPICLSAGLLAYAPFGPAISARGAAAGLLGAAAGGFFAALAARSSFIISSPRASSALVLASLATALLAHEPFTGNLALTGIAMAICILLAGLWQIAFGVIGVGHIIKFTPHPVLAGFVNGVAVLVAMAAYRIVMRGASVHGGVASVLAFAAVLAVLILYIERKTKRVPGPIAGLAIGTAAFYAFGALLPDLPLGPTVGRVAIDLTAVLGSAITGGEAYATALRAEAPQILLTSFVLAVVASLDALLVARVARTQAALPSSPVRFLVGQGIGNIASATIGGVPVSAGPLQTLTNFGAGGRTRLSGLTTASMLFALGILLPALLAAIPLSVLCAILLTISFRSFDRWSFRLLRDTLFRRDRRHSLTAWKNLAIVAAVMTMTAYWSVTAGLLTGIGFSCLIFIVDMSRPLVRRRHRGDALFSRRVRPERDVELLRRSGHLRIVLELEGVMFFGNADDLCAEIEDLFGKANIVVLDFRHVADIDISAVGALQQALSTALARKKSLLFCHLPSAHLDLFESLAGPAGTATIFADLDAALEWSEEKVLAEVGRSEFEEVPFDRIELLEGLDPHQIEVMRNYLMPMAFPAGTVLCHEGEEAGFLWILSRGSVSVWLGGHGEQPGTRIAALARGTIVGEMSLFDEGNRSGTVLADEDVTGYMIDKETFDLILREHPPIATTLLANIAREMARRLRNTSRIVAAETG
jgi:MFS superfamily sulfate permease-like transporter